MLLSNSNADWDKEKQMLEFAIQVRVPNKSFFLYMRPPKTLINDDPCASTVEILVDVVDNLICAAVMTNKPVVKYRERTISWIETRAAELRDFGKCQ